MPSTPLYNFASGEIRLRWTEPYVTEGLNARDIGVKAPGVYRGFKLEPSAGVLSVTVGADAANGDHVAMTALSTGYMLHTRKTGGDFALDLSAFVNKTVVIAVHGTYNIAVTTAADIRVYELSPTDDFTGDADRPFLTVLGTVVVPAAGIIPAANITHARRTSAWQAVPEEAQPWVPVLHNSTFNEGPAANPVLGAQVPSWKLSPLSGNGHFAVVAGAGPGGLSALRLSPDVIASAINVAASQTLLWPVRAGQILRWRAQYRVDQIPTAGSLQLQAQFITDENASGYTPVVAHIFDLSAVSAGYLTVEHVIEVPAGSTHLAAVELVTTVALTYAVASANGIRFGELQLWQQPNPSADPETDRRYAKGYFACFGMRRDTYPAGAPDHAVYNTAVDTDYELQLAGSGALLTALRTDRDSTNATQPGYRGMGAVEAGFAGLVATSDSHRARFRAWYHPGQDWATIMDAAEAAAGTTVPFRLYQMSDVSGLLGGFAFVWGAKLRTSAPFYDWERTNTVTRAMRLLVAGSAGSPSFVIQQAIADGNESVWTSPFAFIPSLAGQEAMFTNTGRMEVGSGMTGGSLPLLPRITMHAAAAVRTALTYSLQGSVTRTEYINTVGDYELAINATWDGAQWVRSSAGDACLVRIDATGLRVFFRDSSLASPWADGAWGYGSMYGGRLALERAAPTIFLTGDNSPASKQTYLRYTDFAHLLATDAVDKNSLHAQNVPKAWFNITTGAAPTINDGYGATSIAAVGNEVQITLQHAIAGAPVRGAVLVTAENTGGVPSFYMGTFNAGGTIVIIQAFDNTNTIVNLSATTQRLSVLVFGRQT